MPACGPSGSARSSRRSRTARSCTPARTCPPREYRDLLATARRHARRARRPVGRRVAGRHRQRHRVRARRPAPHQAPQQRRRRHAAPHTAAAANPELFPLSATSRSLASTYRFGTGGTHERMALSCVPNSNTASSAADSMRRPSGLTERQIDAPGRVGRARASFIPGVYRIPGSFPSARQRCDGCLPLVRQRSAAVAFARPAVSPASSGTCTARQPRISPCRTRCDASRDRSCSCIDHLILHATTASKLTGCLALRRRGRSSILPRALDGGGARTLPSKRLVVCGLTTQDACSPGERRSCASVGGRGRASVAELLRVDRAAGRRSRGSRSKPPGCCGRTGSTPDALQHPSRDGSGSTSRGSRSCSRSSATGSSGTATGSRGSAIAVASPALEAARLAHRARHVGRRDAAARTKRSAGSVRRSPRVRAEELGAAAGFAVAVEACRTRRRSRAATRSCRRRSSGRSRARRCRRRPPPRRCASDSRSTSQRHSSSSVPTPCSQISSGRPGSSSCSRRSTMPRPSLHGAYPDRPDARVGRVRHDRPSSPIPIAE